jgi:hypothetical protein
MARNFESRRRKPESLPLAGMSVECIDALFQANARAAHMWLNTWMKLAAEVGAFTTKRWSHDAELIGRLCGCRTAVDVVELQAVFAERVFKDYMQEAAKLADMEVTAANEEMAEMGKGAREAVEIVSSGRRPNLSAHNAARAH